MTAVSGLTTSLYPSMSDATTGVAHANARVSTIPKLSPPSDGASSALVDFQEVRERVLGEEADDLDPVVGDAEPGEQQPYGERVGAGDDEAGSGCGGGAPARRAGGPGALSAARGGRRRRRCARDRPDPPVRGSGRRWGRPPTALPTSGRPSPAPARRPRSADRCDPSGTPSRACRGASSRDPRRRGGSRPSASAPARAPRRRSQASSGSWRCKTSNRSRSSTRLTRKNDRGLRTMLGSEPFAGTITDRPTGITLAGGFPWRPTRGWRARVNCPRRVVAHHEANLVSPSLESGRLKLCVLDHRPPERPGERHDDADLHPGAYSTWGNLSVGEPMVPLHAPPVPPPGL